MPPSPLSRDAIFDAFWDFAPTLLRIACSRTVCLADAEDAVSDSMLTVAERRDLPTTDDVCALAMVVMLRRCADTHRRRAREQRGILLPSVSEDHALAICDRAEAAWLAHVVERLPKDYLVVAEVLMLGGGVREVAERLGITYKAAEHRVARTRRRLRAVVQAARPAAFVGVIRLAWRARPRPAAPAALSAVTVAAVASLAVLQSPTMHSDVRPGEWQKQSDATPVARQPAPTPAPSAVNQASVLAVVRTSAEGTASPVNSPPPRPHDPDDGWSSPEPSLEPDAVLMTCLGTLHVSVESIGCRGMPTPSPSPSR